MCGVLRGRFQRGDHNVLDLLGGYCGRMPRPRVIHQPVQALPGTGSATCERSATRLPHVGRPPSSRAPSRIPARSLSAARCPVQTFVAALTAPAGRAHSPIVSTRLTPVLVAPYLDSTKTSNELTAQDTSHGIAIGLKPRFTPISPVASVPRAQNSTRPTMHTTSFGCGSRIARSRAAVNSGRPLSATA